MIFYAGGLSLKRDAKSCAKGLNNEDSITAYAEAVSFAKLCVHENKLGFPTDLAEKPDLVMIMSEKETLPEEQKIMSELVDQCTKQETPIAVMDSKSCQFYDEGHIEARHTLPSSQESLLLRRKKLVDWVRGVRQSSFNMDQ